MKLLMKKEKKQMNFKKDRLFSINGMNLRYNLRFMSFYFYPFFIIVSRISFYVV